MATILPPPINPWQQMSQQYTQGMGQMNQQALMGAQLLQKKRQDDLQALLSGIQMQKLVGEITKAQEVANRERMFREELQQVMAPPPAYLGEQDVLPQQVLEEPTFGGNANWQKIAKKYASADALLRWGGEETKILGPEQSLISVSPGGEPRTIVQGKPKSDLTATQKAVAEWKAIPGNENKTIEDFYLMRSGRGSTQYFKTHREAMQSVPAIEGYNITADLTDRGWQPKYLPMPGNIFIGQTPSGGIITIPGRGPMDVKVTPGPEEGVGPKVIGEDYKKDVTALNQAKDLVGQLNKLWDNIGVDSRASGMLAYGQGVAGYNVPAKTYLNMKGAFLGNMSRSIAAERGVLTQQDIERIDKALAALGPNPLTTDNKQEANAKWNAIKQILANSEKRMMQRHTMTPAIPMGKEQKAKVPWVRFNWKGIEHHIPTDRVNEFLIDAPDAKRID